MDREALVIRNKNVTNAFHAVPLRHHIRRALLQAVAHIPVLPSHLRLSHRILLIRPDHLGDVLLTTPAIRALRAARPNLEIHMLVGPWAANIMANYPDVDYVLTVPFPGFSRQPKDGLSSPYRIAFDTSRHLRRIGYDSAVIFRPDHWWGAMVAYLAGIPERIGYQMPDTTPFLTNALESRRDHAVIKNMRLVERWTGPTTPQQAILDFPVNEAQQQEARSLLREYGIRLQEKLVCIHPGSGTWVKQWSATKWAEVADILSEQLEAKIVLTGTQGESHLTDAIEQAMQTEAINLAGKTSIPQLAALYTRSQVALGPDSGPLHLAAAVGTPTVTLFGPADPIEFGPWGPHQKHIVLTSPIGCRPCRILDWADDDPANHPCVREITVAQVLEAARRAANYDYKQKG